ncbi:putative membrane protein [Bradyrhizobium sp. LM4.3]
MFEDVYLWIKALHVIAVISWMAGMLYLPRLFVYHCEAEVGSKQSETFKIMERRLFKAIINPAMIVTWLAGLYLAWAGHWFTFGVAARKTGAGPGDVRGPRLFFAMVEGFRRGPAPTKPEILPNYQ